MSLDVQVFSTPGAATWTKPTGAKKVRVVCIGSGIGGQGGGGGGGYGGSPAFGTVFDYLAVNLGATVAVVVGAGSAGTVGVDFASTATDPATGESSTFDGLGAAGGGESPTAHIFQTLALCGGGGSANGDGSPGLMYLDDFGHLAKTFDLPAGGLGALVASDPGGAGNASLTHVYNGGSGGGGGGSSDGSATGGAGGVGGWPGGGGGGGGTGFDAPTPQNGGNGGAGADGAVIVITECDDSSGGGALSAQQTRDAMKLAPSVGAADAGSVDDQLADIQADLDDPDQYKANISGLPTAAGVWAYATRTLTQSAAQVADIVSGSSITIQRGDTLTAALTGLGAITGYTTLDFTVKQSKDDLDTSAVIRIRKNASGLNDGLLRLNGAAAVTAADGSITLNDQALGNITITLIASDTVGLSSGQGYYYDVQKISAAGVATMATGSFNISPDVTRLIV